MESIVDEYTPIGTVDRHAPKCFSEAGIKSHATFAKENTPKRKQGFLDSKLLIRKNIDDHLT